MCNPLAAISPVAGIVSAMRKKKPSTVNNYYGSQAQQTQGSTGPSPSTQGGSSAYGY